MMRVKINNLNFKFRWLVYNLCTHRFMSRFLDQSESFGDNCRSPFRRKSHAVSFLALPKDQLKLQGCSWGLSWTPSWRRSRSESNNISNFPSIRGLHRARIEGWKSILGKGQNSSVFALPGVFCDQVGASLVGTNREHIDKTSLLLPPFFVCQVTVGRNVTFSPT